MENGGTGSGDPIKYVMAVERKPGLYGLVVTKNLEVMARNVPITGRDIVERIGYDIAEMLRPTCIELTEAQIKEHTAVELLDRYDVTNWCILYRVDDLKAAGFLPKE